MNEIFKIEYNGPNDCFYVKDRFNKILKVLNTLHEAELWLKNHKRDIQNELSR